MPASPLLALGESDFIQLTTFRRTGEAVPTPVWVVPDGDRLAVFTPAGTGKLKRVRHTPRVTVAQCSRRGTVPEGAVRVEAHAASTADPTEVGRVTTLLKRKYGLQFRLFMLVEKVLARGERRREVIHLHPARVAHSADLTAGHGTTP
jgi:PPOX class probable F420-dependent enzyme